ncbi:MAG: hypothetical protein HZA18_03020 [Nitrospirae bacterium]|nr:hypothetical protein [Nitrospirota bacterium]
MKLSKTLSVVVAVAIVFAFVGSGIAKVSKDDTQMFGKVTKISGKSLTIETIGEKSPQTFDMKIMDNAMVMQSDNGKILKVSDIKTGATVNIYCYRKGDDLYARHIWLEVKEDYLTKAILKDAKDGKYFKEIEP